MHSNCPVTSRNIEEHRGEYKLNTEQPGKPQRKVKCRSYAQRRAQSEEKAAAAITWSVPVLTKTYKWPHDLPSTATIAIVELGGGWIESDVKKYFTALHLPIPTITDVSVDGTVNSKQNPTNDADYEVALDIQVAGASFYAATGHAANIRVYWAQDIAPAVAAAAADGCAVCSISWGADEAAWGKAAVEEMEAAAIAATEAGMTVFAAAGDNDSSDGGPGSANVDCPGSCPHVVCCGGTTKTHTAETVWNDNPGQTGGEGTGGGYSTMFPVQAWQIGAPKAPARVPGDKNPGTGRMVPDVAANADPNTGYSIVVYGEWTIIGGTSAVAPLFAGLFAAIEGKPGFVTPTLWAHPRAFVEVTVGSNGDYSAGTHPNPCAGIGVPTGDNVAALFPPPVA